MITQVPSVANRIIQTIPIAEIVVNASFNCRGDILPLDVINLAKSIEEQGLQAPVLVAELNPTESAIFAGKKYKLISGFRRTKAHEILKKVTIDCIVRPPIRDIDARLLNLSENLERENLNILQEANAVRSLRELQMSRDEIAERLHQSMGWVQIRGMLLDLPEDIQKEAAAGFVGQHAIRDLYSLRFKRDELYEAVRIIKEKKFKGEKAIRIKPKSETVLKKRRRDTTEMYQLICHILQHTGPNFGTRCLAWASGNITDLDIYQDIQKMCKEQNKPYAIPTISITNLPRENQ